MTTQLEIDQLASALEGNLSMDALSKELGALVALAENVTRHTAVPLPTAAFREALRTDLLQQLAAPVSMTTSTGSAGATSTGSAGSTTGSVATAATSGGAVTSGMASIIAGVTAAAVLAVSGVSVVAPSAVPGDALYETKRLLETIQLSVGDLEGDVARLLELATERVDEALGLADDAAVLELLEDADQHLDDALSMLDELPTDVAEQLLADFVGPHSLAIMRLLDADPSATIAAQAQRLLARTASIAADLPPVQAPVELDEDGLPIEADDTPVDSGSTDDGTTPVDGATDGIDDVTDSVDDIVDDVTDTVDDVTDDVTDPVDDITDPVDDVIDDVTDDVTDAVDDVVGDVTDTVDSSVGSLLP